MGECSPPESISQAFHTTSSSHLQHGRAGNEREWPGHTTDWKPVPQKSRQQPDGCARNHSSFLDAWTDLQEQLYFEEWKRWSILPLPSPTLHRWFLVRGAWCRALPNLCFVLPWSASTQPIRGLTWNGFWAVALWREHQGRLSRDNQGWWYP